MRWKCTCMYDGSGYSGWQVQDEHESVQQLIEKAIFEILNKKVSIHGSGRTDSGVHALEQVFHFDCDWKHGGESLCKALCTKLPRSIRIISAVEVADDFHARFSAKLKRYQYRLYLGEANPFQWPYSWSVSTRLNLNIVAAEMKSLLGEHDFGAFAANRGVDYESTVRTMTRAHLTQDSEYVYLTFEANGFMYKMVRSLAGTLVNAGLGRIDQGEVARLLQSSERTPHVLVAPAQGLFLEKVIY